MFYSKIIKEKILNKFFKIDLSNVEKEIALESVDKKYAKCIKNALISALFIFPATLFLETNILITVLIPITMVAGTAWFAVSLADIKKKFENFGLELTINLFNSFLTSLAILAILTLVSLNSHLFSSVILTYKNNIWISVISGILGTIVVFNLIKNVFYGSLKYDINDAMLTGQNEVAERFYKRSLSFLHSSAENLKSGKGIQIANYYIGVSFYEIFEFVQQTGILNRNFEKLMDDAMKLKNTPSMSQEKADAISLNLIENFLRYCINITDEKVKKSHNNIKSELENIKKNSEESQNMIDTRFAIIFEEIADMIESQGESLFKKNK